VSHARTCARDLTELSEAQGFAYRLAQSHILEGWTEAAGEQDSQAIQKIQHAIERTRATGAQVLLPYYQVLLADACLRVRRKTLAFDIATEALGVVRRTGECFFKAELQRLQGESLANSKNHSQQATRSFSSALATARRQKAASLELRAVLSWAAIQSRKADARREVQQVMNRLHDGFQTTTFKSAKQFVRGTRG
jgi:predicted ATPase